MTGLTTAATASVFNLLTAPAGLDIAVNAIAHSFGNGPTISPGSVLVGNTPPEFLEKSAALRYPTIHVYCDKASNKLVEKFRVFSGKISIVVEVRHSHDQIGQVQETLETYISAVCEILDSSRGDLGNGIFYSGGYEVSFAPLKRGGLNFLQIGRVAMELDASV